MLKNSNDLTRRQLLNGAAAALGALGTGRLGFAQDSAGPPVWLDMDQAALNAAYDQTAYAPDMQSHIARRSRRNADALARMAEPSTFSYGPRPIENLDVHLSLQADRPAPINIFFHGGAWRASTARDHAWMAETIINAGGHCVIPDYSLVQDVGGDLAVLGDEVRRAVAWVYENAAQFDGDPERIHITGHSAGGHLAGVVMTADWAGDFGLPADFIAGGLITSGMFDLEPVRLSSRSEYVTITEDAEEDLSAQRHIDRLTAPLILAYGTLETPEFKRQTQDFAAAVRAAGKPVELIVAEGHYHLEMAESLANPYGLLGRAILEQMGLA